MVWALVYLSITSPLGEHISYIPFHDDSSKLRMIPRNSKNYQQFLSVPSYTIVTRSCNHQYNCRNHILKKSKDFRFPTQSSPKKKHQVANISAQTIPFFLGVSDLSNPKVLATKAAMHTAYAFEPPFQDVIPMAVWLPDCGWRNWPQKP